MIGSCFALASTCSARSALWQLERARRKRAGSTSWQLSECEDLRRVSGRPSIMDVEQEIERC